MQSIRTLFIGPRIVGAGGPSGSGVGGGGCGVREAVGDGRVRVAEGAAVRVAVAAGAVGRIVAGSADPFAEPPIRLGPAVPDAEGAVCWRSPVGRTRRTRAAQSTDSPSRDARPAAIRHPHGRPPSGTWAGLTPSSGRVAAPGR